MSERIGRGRVVAGGERHASGRFAAVLDVQDLLRLMDVSETALIVYLIHPNVTMMAPIYDRITGLACEHGDFQSHVAIVARELGVPCLVQTTLERDVQALEGRTVRIDPSGALELED